MTESSHFENRRSLDLICMGRVAVDLYAEQVHSPLEDAQSFRKYLGGCAGNTAVGTARLGLKSAMFSCVGADDMGVYLRNVLTNEGVDTSLLRNRTFDCIGFAGRESSGSFPLDLLSGKLRRYADSSQRCKSGNFQKRQSLVDYRNRIVHTIDAGGHSASREGR